MRSADTVLLRERARLGRVTGGDRSELGAWDTQQRLGPVGRDTSSADDAPASGVPRLPLESLLLSLAANPLISHFGSTSILNLARFSKEPHQPVLVACLVVWRWALCIRSFSLLSFIMAPIPLTDALLRMCLPLRYPQSSL